ncbi:MAG: type II toxin-antitoxin system VapC family toxin [Gemmatimonadaceae bacterium]|nr:type II toxin-antitoxin system VapC family toxin [Gemmatimonadaceae bacterium]
MAPRAASPPSSAVVLDASVVVEVVLSSAAGRQAMAQLVAQNAVLHAPELLDIEVLHVVRRALARQLLTPSRAEQALGILEALPLARHTHAPLRRRCWQLRANLSAYDATYVALAEGLGARLLTRDARIAKVVGLGAAVEVV